MKINSNLRSRALNAQIELGSLPTTINITVIVAIAAILFTLIIIACRNKWFITDNAATASEDGVLPILKVKKYQKKPVRTFQRFFDSLLPLEYKLPFIQLSWLMLRIHHDLSPLRLKYVRAQSSLPEKWFFVLSKVLTFLWIDTVLNLWVYGDFGHCASYHTASECSGAVVVPQITTSICEWNTTQQSCHYRSTGSGTFNSDSTINLFILVIVMLLANAVIDRGLKFLLSHAKLRLKLGVCSCLSEGDGGGDSQQQTTNTPPEDPYQAGLRQHQQKYSNNTVVPLNAPSKRPTSIGYYDSAVSDFQAETKSNFNHDGRAATSGISKDFHAYHSNDEHFMDEFGDELAAAQTRKVTLVRGAW